MIELKKILDAKAHPGSCKLVYCTRTVPEIDKALAELKRLIAYREKVTGDKLKFLGIGLSSRRNLCINSEVVSEKVGKAIDSKCHSLTASWVRQRARTHPGEQVKTCRFYENIEELGGSRGLSIPSGVYTMEDLKEYGQENGLCPYFLSRLMLQQANVIIYSYYYLLDPKVAELVSRDLPKDAIVVFDEAHNIDNVCIESLSVDINRRTLDAASRSVQKLAERIQEIKSTDAERLRDEYTRLVEGLRRTNEGRLADEIMANPVIPDELLQEVVPGNIRQGEHFVAFLRRFVEYLKTKLRTPHVITESPTAFIQSVRDATTIERKPLRFCAERLQSLVKTLELARLDELSALQRVANFATIVATYPKGFLVILEPFEDQAPSVPNPVLHLCCLDATIAIKPVFSRFQSVIITSGTLSPLDMYPKILNFSTVLMQSFPMTLSRNIVCPLIVTRGSDQVSMTSRFEIRNDPAVVRNYGNLLLDFCRITPDGLVCFFPSYIYLEMIVTMWHEMGILNEVLRHKLLFIETPDSVETSIALENYRRACDNGRGAVLLSVARGKVSEGIDFDHHYGRAVIMFGIPYQYTESRILKARLEYMREQYGIRENDFLTFDALRHAAQCLGRVLRGKNDYGLMVLADKRFARYDKRAKLPKWLTQAILETNVNLSADMAVQLGVRFFREMAQPFDAKAQVGSTMLSEEDIRNNDRPMVL
ncbi:ATP-dependent helicase domain-containing protein [Paramicrosporidium saccamoebae]|uniref:DNA 5'-3' helicase n=1 Tax=Paramicrosporidium saccamoebae TaxID=1246581 RepID=A0A2H9TLV7_9FUNG|nr:ATP-dependent helicase domain-containing protein [Paramicrosporidium saccamoebae]